MQNKNYYKILELTHSASQHDIKKAFRQLAMKYHPDKNGDNKFAEAHFREIQEAYQVLSDPNRRSAYNQSRWYRQSMRRETPSEIISPASILKKCRDLNRYISELDAFRINQQALHQYIMHLLSEKNLLLLIESKDNLFNTSVIDEFLKASQPLSYMYMRKVGDNLIRLAGDDYTAMETIYSCLKERRMQSYWQQYQPLIILIITLVLCWVIYALSK